VGAKIAVGTLDRQDLRREPTTLRSQSQLGPNSILKGSYGRDFE
jgi:hypothetical protein